MPTYQYACTACGEQLEAVQAFTDAPLTECTVCRGRLRKVFSAVGVVFKGSGFYKTDSRASTGTKSGDGGDSGGGGGGKEGAAKTDGAAAAKSDASSSSGGAATSAPPVAKTA